jgi:hypothetical protein
MPMRVLALLFASASAQPAIHGRARNPFQRRSGPSPQSSIRHHAGEHGDGSFRSHQAELLTDEILGLERGVGLQEGE